MDVRGDSDGLSAANPLAEQIERSAFSQDSLDILWHYLERNGFEARDAEDVVGQRGRRIWEVLQSHRDGRSTVVDVRNQLGRIAEQWRLFGLV